MPWFAAHVVMQVKFKELDQITYPVWENIFLIDAPSDDLALDIAEQVGRSNEGDSEGSFEWEGKKAKWVYLGIRKLIEVRNSDSNNYSITNRTEASYNTLEFDNKKDLKDFLEGNHCKVKVIE